MRSPTKTNFPYTNTDLHFVQRVQNARLQNCEPHESKTRVYRTVNHTSPKRASTELWTTRVQNARLQKCEPNASPKRASTEMWTTRESKTRVYRTVNHTRVQNACLQDCDPHDSKNARTILTLPCLERSSRGRI
jgi:hypothetical protein